MTCHHERKSYMPYIKRWFLFLLTVTSIGLFLYHPYFHITDISVQGTQRLHESDIVSTIQKTLNHNYVFIIPANHIVFSKTRVIKNVLMNKYPLEEVVITKYFPDSIEVTLQEKISTVIYNDGEQYSYVGANGDIIERLRSNGPDEYITIQVNSSTERVHKINRDSLIQEFGDYPIVLDARKTVVSPSEEKELLQPATITHIIDWYTKLRKHHNLPLKYFRIDNNIFDGSILTDEGWEIRVSFHDNVEETMQTLQYVLDEHVQRPNFSYIDLRFGNRVFWR